MTRSAKRAGDDDDDISSSSPAASSGSWLAVIGSMEVGGAKSEGAG